jgi:hypothetical protein
MKYRDGMSYHEFYLANHNQADEWSNKYAPRSVKTDLYKEWEWRDNWFAQRQRLNRNFDQDELLGCLLLVGMLGGIIWGLTKCLL